jgi:hypothetical protein
LEETVLLFFPLHFVDFCPVFVL